MKLAFIGLGIMGEPMAGHLLAAGHSLAVHSRTQSKADGLLSRGATWAATPAAAAEGAEVVLICVTDTPDVKAVIEGPDGIGRTLGTDAAIVDHSTISPAVTRQIAETLGRAYVDAPVSGGDVGARNGTLSIMCGGEESAFRGVEPVLKCYGKTITYCGGVGTGQITKLVNQVLVSVTNLAVCEAMTFARKSGLNPDATLAAVGGGAAGSWQLTNLGPRMAKGDFAPGFMIDLQQKDLRLVMEWAQEQHVALPAAGLVHQLFTAAQAVGGGRDGTQALYRVIGALAGDLPKT